MRIFVTGGAGFIGSHLVDKLVNTGTVTVYDSLSSGKKEFIEHHLDRNDFAFVQADLLESDTLRKAMQSHDVVFHMAANPEARWGIQNTRLDLEQETIATYNILEAMRVNEIKQIVFASSGTIYGETPVMPIPEDYGPVLPISLYGAGKLASEGLISAFCGTFAMQAWIFRFANIVGKRATHGVILDFIQKLKQNPSELEILGDGNQCKPYLHIEDCVEGILFAFKSSFDKLNIFNLGCSSVTDVNTIARMLVEEMGLRGVSFKYTGGDRGWPGDVPQVRLNVAKINRLGWKAGYTSDEAVKKAIREMLGKEEDASGYSGWRSSHQTEAIN